MVVIARLLHYFTTLVLLAKLLNNQQTVLKMNQSVMLSVMGVMTGDGLPSPALPTGSKAELKCDEVMTIYPIANKLQSNC